MRDINADIVDLSSELKTFQAKFNDLKKILQ
jgi:hypothetical protein